jgi:hypothetical protein
MRLFGWSMGRSIELMGDGSRVFFEEQRERESARGDYFFYCKE